LFALILLTGVFPSSVFWVSAKYLPAANQRISSLREQKPAVESEYDALPATDRLEDRFQPEPMPSLTWCAAWSLWMFCSAFAGWRAWRLQVSADFVQGDSRIPGFFLGALACSAAVAWGLWHRMQDFSLADDWQVLCGLAAAAAGWLCSARICRDPQLAEERFQQLGSWARLTKRELYLNDLIAAAHEGPLRGMARLSETVDWGLHQLVPQVIVDKVIGPVVIAVEELRSQSASFYAGALLLTIGSLLLTWLSLTG
jgi:hypothetical protein